MRLKVEEAEQLVYKIFSKVTFEEYARYLAEEIVDSKVDGHSGTAINAISPTVFASSS
ncbi:MAG: hypothetical protein RXR08_05665 [Sulfolobaceae archaeon]